MTALTVTNTTYFITRNIEQAPSDPMMVRELVQNAIEAAIYSPTPKIHILGTDPNDLGYANFGFSDPKLTFWNNGRGMSAKELREAVNLSSSLNKVQRIDENFGIGAKALCLSVNQAGMIWITCKDGKISTAMLYKNSKSEYARYDFVDIDSESPTGYKDIWDITDVKTIPWDRNSDWTAIILCGNNPKQNTIKSPYDPAHTLTPAWLINEIYRRYFKIPENLELKLSVGHSKGKDVNVNFKTLYNYVQEAKVKKPNDIIEELVDDKFDELKFGVAID